MQFNASILENIKMRIAEKFISIRKNNNIIKNDVTKRRKVLKKHFFVVPANWILARKFRFGSLAPPHKNLDMPLYVDVNATENKRIWFYARKSKPYYNHTFEMVDSK